MKYNLAELERPSWHGGQLLAFSGLDGPTDFQHGLTARTADGPPDIEILLPATGRLQFPYPVATVNTVAGDWLVVGQTRAVLLDAHHLLVDGPCDVRELAPGLTTATGSNRTLVGSASHFNATLLAADLEAALAERQRWLAAQPLPTGLSPQARRTLLKALSIMKTQVYTPEGRIRHRWTTPDRWPHRRMWLWDSAFHAIGWRHLDPGLAREAIAAVLDLQAADGFVPHMMAPDGISAITQPPVLALATKLVGDLVPDRDWLASIYPKLVAYVDWIAGHRDSDGGGLVEWAIEGNPHCRSGESGMDNSPRFDAATRMDAVDFNAFLSLECEILADFADTLGRPQEAVAWQARQTQINQLIRQRLWSERLQFFVDFDLERQTHSPVLASAGFLPLICGAATPAQAARLAEHLVDPTRFASPLPVPSIAVRDVEHYAKDMWRGPVWINLNWLIARGFDRYGFADQAATLRQQTRQAIEAAGDQYATLFEFYDDRQQVAPPNLLRKGRCAPADSPYHQVVHDYGWTATLYADLLYATG